jgi:hypothetical protein
MRDLINHHVKEQEGPGLGCACREFDAAARE